MSRRPGAAIASNCRLTKRDHSRETEMPAPRVERWHLALKTFFGSRPIDEPELEHAARAIRFANYVALHRLVRVIEQVLRVEAAADCVDQWEPQREVERRARLLDHVRQRLVSGSLDTFANAIDEQRCTR